MTLSAAPADGYRAALGRDLEALVACPRCRGTALSLGVDRVLCAGCGAAYPVDAGRRLALLSDAESENAAKRDIRAWWGDLYAQLYAETDAKLTTENLDAMLADLEDLFSAREHLAAVEMPGDLKGKRVLEIGSGGGGHSALFARRGADMRAVDLTPVRAQSTALKLSLVAGGGIAYQADAEALPFRDDSFDIVYSNGVLHHSPSTEACVAEVRRVLKPGGRAVIMLYARHSAVYWCNIVPRGLVSGAMFRWPEAEWIGRVTEGNPKFGAVRNPITRVYSAKGIDRLFKDFRMISRRKSSFQFDNFAIPRLTQAREAVLKTFGRAAHPGGVLVYGRPAVPETGLELRLGRALGFAWNVIVEKPT